MSRIPKHFSFRWWQLALYELALFSLGAGIAGLYPDTFADLWHIFLLIFIVIAPYVLYLYLGQIGSGTDSSTDNEKDENS